MYLSYSNWSAHHSWRMSERAASGAQMRSSRINRKRNLEDCIQLASVRKVNRLFLRVAVCVNTDRDTYPLPGSLRLYLSRSGIWRSRGGACGRYSRRIWRPSPPRPLSSLSLASSLYQPFTLPSERSPLLSSNHECLYDGPLFTSKLALEAAVHLPADQLVLSVSAWDAVCLQAQPPALPIVPSFLLCSVSRRSGQHRPDQHCVR